MPKKRVARKKPAKKKAEKPRVLSILFCDHAVKEEGTGKYTLVGVFTYFRSQKYPVFLGRFFTHIVFANITAKEHTFALTITKSGTRKPIGEMSGKLKLEQASKMSELALPINNLRIEEPGQYTFSFNLDEKFVGKRVIEAQSI